VTVPLPTVVEGLLFAADSSLSLDRLCEVLTEFERDEIREALATLAAAYEERSGAIQLVEVAGGWHLRTRPVCQQYVTRLIRQKAAKFSQSSLETLAIVAYRQPVTRAEVEHLRGVDCGGVLKSLLEKKLVKILGKKDIPGRPLVYGTSKEFLEVFGLRDLRSLPTLREIQALHETAHYERQEELPLGQESAGESADAPLPFDRPTEAGDMPASG
jgi:segregation and condensation protein B